MARSVLTPQADDFPRWYQDVIAKAQLAENGPARGTMIIRPWGFAIWEHIRDELDDRIKATGHENAYFPLFIPMSFLTKEAEHVEGFSPELAVVTHGGGSELGESLAVRPTSETVIGDAMARWVQSHRDLPLLLNQWANVVRWELRPRLFLRTSEFLWQEGHTAHATWQDAQDETLRMHDVYDDMMRNVFAIAPVLGRKTERERFAGAEATYTLEGLMRDGKALQLGTSHHLGQNFARAFDIGFSDTDGERQLCWTTSWGMSTRTIGAMIMVHGDDAGLRLPPKLAPAQVVVLAVREEAADACRDLVDELGRLGVRARLDADTHTGFGRRATDWELKGVPVRVELGPRDLENGVATLVRRDAAADEQKSQVPLAGAAATIAAMLPEVHDTLLSQSDAFRRAHTHDAADVDEVITATGDGRTGFHRVPWSAVGPAGEDRLAGHALTVRCLTTHDDAVPAPDAHDDELVAWIAKAY